MKFDFGYTGESPAKFFQTRLSPGRHGNRITVATQTGSDP